MNRKTWIASAICIIAMALTMIDLHGGGTPPASAGDAAADPPNTASGASRMRRPAPGKCGK